MAWLWVALIVLLAAASGWYVVRLQYLRHRIGSFECARMRNDRWLKGYACYAVGRLDWYPVVSVASRPALSWRRGDLDVITVEHDVGDGRARVVVEGDGVRHTLLMPAQAYSGVRSWIESAPPTPATYK